jgi:hypothetical protein
MWWPLRGRARELVVAAEPHEVLQHGVDALRRLGARITRYDIEAGTAEARWRRFARPALVRLRTAPEGPRATRLSVESDALACLRAFRRLRVDLRGLERRS